jgi:cytochrome P450
MPRLALPGPRPWPFIGNLAALSKDVLGFLTHNTHHHGDRCYWTMPGERVVQLGDPQDIEHVLLRNRDVLAKDPITASLSRLIGDGLITSEGAVWKQSRKLASPSFKPKHLAAYGHAMVRSAIEAPPHAGQQDVHPWMTRITLHIVLRTLFGAEPGGEADQVAQRVEGVMASFDTEYHSAARLVPDWVPLPHRQRLDRGALDLRALLDRLVQERKSGDSGDDLLWALIEARDEAGNGFSDRALRDEALTLFLAGHETTALTLSYTLWLLATHPDLQDRAIAEIEEVLGDRDAGAPDLRKLPFIHAIIDEAMRLYPPAWTIGRLALRDIDLDGLTIPAGHHVLMPQWVVHRDPRWWTQPEAFRPDRWLNGETDDLARFAYFPFGGGERVCIGNHFAKMEAVLVIVALLRRHSFTEVSGYTPDLLPSVTLRSHNGVHVTVQPRASAVTETD